MSSFSQLKLQAISAAKQGQWSEAVTFNLTALDQNPDDAGTLNRLGVAYLNTGDHAKAKKMFQQVLELDKTNLVAQKNLARLKSQNTMAPLFTSQQFIEEPGKTKVVELHRLASKEVLANLRVGTPCVLKVKKRFISVEALGHYLGALPEDLSFRLSKLMESGNLYDTAVWASSATSCHVYLKEVFRAPANKDSASFPGSRSALPQADEYDPFLTNDFQVETTPDEELIDSLDSLIPAP